MKRVIMGDELYNIKKSSVNIICDAVASTLGPTGNNILINNSEMSPFITNDGVTIASNIESDDSGVNSILEIVKEASIKTNTLVGDGTTTTMVLLQSIFNLGLEEINKGKSPIVLKNELISCIPVVIEEINKLKRKYNSNDLLNIASIASNDNDIGKFISNIYNKMKCRYSIHLEESNTDNTYYKINYGYDLEIDNISNMYFNKSKDINLNNCYILLLKGYLDNLETIREVVNEVITTNKNLIIFVEEMNESIKQELLVYYLNNNLNIFIIKFPDFASHREKIEMDISSISGCTIKNVDLEKVYYTDLGIIDNLVLTKEKTILSINKDKVVDLIHDLKDELNNCSDDYEKEFISSRLAKLENGIATIYVGGNTKTEIKEKLMRFEDALCALEISKRGIVRGGGVTLLEVSSKLNGTDSGSSIIKESLIAPFKKIAENTGEDYKIILDNIINSNYKKIYNFKTHTYEENTTVLDPIEVVITSLKNAVSIASILLTTEYLVINEKINIEKNLTSTYM